MSKPFDISLIAGEELRFLTKQITTYNNVLIDQNELKRHVSLSDIDKSGYNWAAQFNIFSALPREVFFTILENMDLESVFRLRASNKQLKGLIESWGPYQIVMRDACSAVKALIATKASKMWTIPELQTKIYTTQCEHCGAHGEILHLLKMKRVCFKCVTTEREFLAVSLNFAMYMMGLSQEEAYSLPRLNPIRQKTFWGHPQELSLNPAVDYNAAVEMSIHKFKGQGSGLCMPKFVLEPPESSYIQHRCCTYFPAQKWTENGPEIVKAALCAGCVFFWNYHSPLPYQCHTLYRHDRSGMLNGAQTQLQTHLASCVYAAAYWTKLYLPALNHRDASNPHLAINGGQFTPKEMLQSEQVRLIGLFDQKMARFRHFHRHPMLVDGREDLRGQHNNIRFEEIPEQLLQQAQSVSSVRCRTALELELEAKKEAGDPEICAALSDAHDWCLSKSEQLHISRIRQEEQWRKQNGLDLQIDTYADALIGNGASVSQANWALAKPSQSQNLFGGWARLLEERKWREAEAAARDSGRKAEQLYKTIRGWGFDRFGNVSSLA